MIPSNPIYGGDKMQIAKGNYEQNDHILAESAIREAEEELGLYREFLNKVEMLGIYKINGFKSSYDLTIYEARISDNAKWNKPHYETSWSDWVDIDTAIKDGRKNQIPILKDLQRKIKGI